MSEPMFKTKSTLTPEEQRIYDHCAFTRKRLLDKKQAWEMNDEEYGRLLELNTIMYLILESR